MGRDRSPELYLLHCKGSPQRKAKVGSALISGVAPPFRTAIAGLKRLRKNSDYNVILSAAKDLRIPVFKQLQGSFVGFASSG